METTSFPALWTPSLHVGLLHYRWKPFLASNFQRCTREFRSILRNAQYTRQFSFELTTLSRYSTILGCVTAGLQVSGQTWFHARESGQILRSVDARDPNLIARIPLGWQCHDFIYELPYVYHNEDFLLCYLLWFEFDKLTKRTTCQSVKQDRLFNLDLKTRIWNLDEMKISFWHLSRNFDLN